MPLYDFRCLRCEHDFEELVSADDPAVCPECSSAEVERKLPVFAVGGSRGQELPPPGCGTCGDPRGPGACSL